MRKFNLVIVFLLLSFVLRAQDTLSLQQAIEIGLQNNYGIRLQKNDLAIAENNNTIGNAGMLPAISGNATISNNVANTRQEFYSGEVRSADNANSSSVNAGLQLQWTVFDGFSMFIEKNKLGKLQLLSESQLQAQVESTVADIITAYFDISRQEQLVSVLEDIVAVSSRRKFIAETKTEIGAGSKLSALQSTADFNADTAQLVQQAALIEGLKTQLNQLMAREPATKFEVSKRIEIAAPLNETLMLSAAEESNPNLSAARISSEIAKLNIGTARSQRFPSLTVFSGYNFNQAISEVGLLQLNRSIGPSYGVTASIPIFNGFNINRQVENARLASESGQLQYEQQKLEVRSQIHDLYANYAAQLELVRLEGTNLEVARKTAFAAQERFNVGNLSDIDFRQAQISLRDAEIRYLAAQYNAKLYETRLLYYSGKLAESYQP